MKNLKWIWKEFKELTTDELYQIIHLRERVFVVEQKCAYQDVDGYDIQAWHLMGFEKDKLVAYLRVLPPNTRFHEISIGRVLTAPEVRKLGYGKELMQMGLEKIQEKFGAINIQISAQAYLKKYYEEFGFKIASDQYLEDDIPHYEMLRSK